MDISTECRSLMARINVGKQFEWLGLHGHRDANEIVEFSKVGQYLSETLLMIAYLSGKQRYVENDTCDECGPTTHRLYYCIRGLAASFGHAEHCFFDSLDTQKFMSEFAEDDFS